MPADQGPSEIVVHASCIALDGRAALIRGASGSGKSTLALTLMALGAALVADDRVILRQVPGGIEASAPAAIAGLIEARGMGLLRARALVRARVACVVDLDVAETERLPPRRTTVLLGHEVDLLHRCDTSHLAPALLQYLAAGRLDPT